VHPLLQRPAHVKNNNISGNPTYADFPFPTVKIFAYTCAENVSRPTINWFVSLIFTWVLATLPAGIVFRGVCLSVCLSVRVSAVCVRWPHKSRKLLIRNWCKPNLVEMCPTVNTRSVWKLVTFDFDLWPWELFSFFSINHNPTHLIHS